MVAGVVKMGVELRWPWRWVRLRTRPGDLGVKEMFLHVVISTTKLLMEPQRML